MSDLLIEKWNRLAFAKDSTTVIVEKKLKKGKDDPCQTGWTMRGLKPGKDGGEVPNCVPQEGHDPLEESDETLAEDKDRPGMWHYINKNKKEGKPPKKPGEEGYPSEKAWKENTKKEASDPLDETDEMFSGLEEADASQAPEDSESYTVTMTEADEADENFMGAIAAAAKDGKDEVEIDGKTFPVEMEDDTVEAITGEKPKDAVDEAISRWYNLLNEDGFDKEKKDKMKCNDERYLRDGEPGHGEKQKVVKACDPDSDKEKIIKFGDANMKNKSNVDSNRESFRARHNCSDKSLSKDWDTASYWACKDW